MGNCVNKKKIFNPGAVLDRVIAGSGPEDECLLYKLANFKKGVGNVFYLARYLFFHLRVNWWRRSQGPRERTGPQRREEVPRRWRS